MTPDETLRRIQQGDLLPVYFLYGAERFYHTEILAALTARLITPDNRDFNLETFDAKESGPHDWTAAAKTMSFLGGTKMVVVRGLHEASLSESDVSRLLDTVGDPPADTCLVLTADQADRKRKLYKSLTALPGAVTCEAPKEAALVPWLKKRAQDRGVPLSMDAARLMLDRLGAKPGLLAQELEKVITYVGKNENITENDVAAVVGDVRKEQVFALTDALKQKNAEQAVRLLHNQLDHGEDPIKVLGMIAWQFRVIWEVKHHQEQRTPIPQIAQKMGAKPFLVEKAVNYTKNFSRSHLAESFKVLSQADRELKSSGKNPEG
ncbi:MAG: DNA polymerase III subunit delta, partial [Nitrospinaceae bacterium]|nr:DNA polymerase III subunit delta [Nitrospinaceae bacterium]NIS85456.1 DNA polymerase III subunit delta [Nitrospinaceae bacterium]NIT82290.1 DNA polymerase III subunit delta [Nitrospinaceae bacterium]NIU96660.1 DNA polymerase III subunit delta [Nitrospinaceae bacterium]NIY15509.1 DNA polymerase III subunit delta [Nitrospinaceae bacterium]